MANASAENQVQLESIVENGNLASFQLREERQSLQYHWIMRAVIHAMRT